MAFRRIVIILVNVGFFFNLIVAIANMENFPYIESKPQLNFIAIMYFCYLIYGQILKANKIDGR